MNPADPTPRNPHGQTLAQFVARLEDHFPAAYLRSIAPQPERLWHDGRTVDAAARYLSAWCGAPVIVPPGAEDTRPPTWGECAEMLGCDAAYRDTPQDGSSLL